MYIEIVFNITVCWCSLFVWMLIKSRRLISTNSPVFFHQMYFFKQCFVLYFDFNNLIYSVLLILFPFCFYIWYAYMNVFLYAVIRAFWAVLVDTGFMSGSGQIIIFIEMAVFLFLFICIVKISLSLYSICAIYLSLVD